MSTKSILLMLWSFRLEPLELIKNDLYSIFEQCSNQDSVVVTNTNCGGHVNMPYLTSVAKGLPADMKSFESQSQLLIDLC